ncbi:MAG: lipid A oxidase, partial [Paracoccaceae bacterium]
MVRWVLIIIFVQAAMSAPLGAQVELSIYGGFQSSPDSNVSGNDPGGIGIFDFSAEWESRSLRAPPNYGARLTWWPSRVLGLGVDYSYDKLFGSAATLADNGLTQLEFSEG